MAKIKQSQPLTFRFYTSAEVAIEHMAPTQEDGPSIPLINLRFRTTEHKENGGKVDSVTPWVAFTQAAAEHLSTQLALTVETAKRWVPGEPAPSLGGTQGIIINPGDPQQ